MLFGESQQLNEIFTGEIEPIYNIDDYVKELKYKLQLAHDQAIHFTKRNKEINKFYYDQKTNSIKISVGDQIKIEKEPRNKHKQIYEGPFTVQEIQNENLIFFDKSGKRQTIHKNRTAKF